MLKEKMARLKVLIKKWNKEVFGVVDLEVNSVFNVLNKLGSMVAFIEGGINLSIVEPELLLPNLCGMLF